MSGFSAKFSAGSKAHSATAETSQRTSFDRAKPEEKSDMRRHGLPTADDLNAITQDPADAALLARRIRQTRIMTDATRDLTENTRPSQREIDAYKELFYQFADRMLPADRRLISAMLARSPYTPRSVAIYLANDRAEIAAPMLLFSPVLDRADLRAIANKNGPGHRNAIARRMADAGEAAFTATPDNPLPAVLDMKTDTVQMAPATPTAEPVRRFETDDVEEAALPGRFDRLYKMPAPARVEPPVAEPVEAITTAMSEQTAAPLTKTETELLALAGRGGKLGTVHPDQHAKAKETTDATSETSASVTSEHVAPPPIAKRRYDTLPMRESDALTALARKRDFAELARQIASYSGLAENTILKLLKAQQGEEIVYLIRALNLPKAKELTFLLAVQPRFSRGPERLAQTRKLLSELDTGICRIIFNQIGADFTLPELETLELRKAQLAEQAESERQDPAKAAPESAAPAMAAPVASATKPSADGTEDFYRTLHQRRAEITRPEPIEDQNEKRRDVSNAV